MMIDEYRIKITSNDTTKMIKLLLICKAFLFFFPIFSIFIENYFLFYIKKMLNQCKAT